MPELVKTLRAQVESLRFVPRESCETKQDIFHYLRRVAGAMHAVVNQMEEAGLRQDDAPPRPSPLPSRGMKMARRRQTIRSVMTASGAKVRVVERGSQLDLGL